MVNNEALDAVVLSRWLGNNGNIDHLKLEVPYIGPFNFLIAKKLFQRTEIHHDNSSLLLGEKGWGSHFGVGYLLVLSVASLNLGLYGCYHFPC